jgi:hypothetical protein
MIEEIPIVSDNVSFFSKPISNIYPFVTYSLSYIFSIIRDMDLLKETKSIRLGEADKKEVLPYFTPAGVFSRRCADDIESYSGIVHVDVDNLDPLQYTWKRKYDLLQTIASDTFLKPAMIYISPSGNGMKIFIRVTNPDPSCHASYIRAIGYLLNLRFNLPIDTSCIDLPRACFVCHDPYAYFSSGSVSSDDLLQKLPPSEEVPLIVSQINSITSHFNFNPTWDQYRCNKLKHCPEVHEYAETLLQRRGWHRRNHFWRRPGKEKGISAVYNINPVTGMWSFRNFSSNGDPFKTDRNYSDLDLISLLAFNEDFDKCINKLSFQFRKIL